MGKKNKRRRNKKKQRELIEENYVRAYETKQKTEARNPARLTKRQRRIQEEEAYLKAINESLAYEESLNASYLSEAISQSSSSSSTSSEDEQMMIAICRSLNDLR